MPINLRLAATIGIAAAVMATWCTTAPVTASPRLTPFGSRSRPAASLAAANAPATGPMVTEATREYTTMAATRYQHQNRESEANHTYFYDCVGFVSYAMSRAAPTAWATARDTLHIRKGYVPSPAHYASLFATVNGGTSITGWAPVQSVTALQPGDVIVWYYDAAARDKPGSASGHAVVVAETPTPTGPDAYSALVYDSTATPHGPNDTRLTNRANQPGPVGKPSGLGEGTIGILATAGGQIAAVQWSSGGRAVASAHYAMARPVS